MSNRSGDDWGWLLIVILICLVATCHKVDRLERRLDAEKPAVEARE
jgi:hypothetical protein